MADIWANLDGGRFLADLYAKDSVQAAFQQKIITAINSLGSQLGANPVGEVQPPPTIDNINTSVSGEMLHVSLNHNHPVGRPINYFTEIDTNPNFAQPIVVPMGPSRTMTPMSLPTFPATGKLKHNYYVRAYAQYPGSKPSKPTVFGGPLSAASIQMGGGTAMNLLPSTGSGTASSTGQQGASGFGKTLQSIKIQGAIQNSIGPATPQQNTVAPSNVGSLQFPGTVTFGGLFTVSGASPITALPGGGAIIVTLNSEPAQTFFAGPPALETLPQLDKTAVGSGTSSPLTTAAVTPSRYPEFAISAWSGEIGSGTTTPVSPWTQLSVSDSEPNTNFKATVTSGNIAGNATQSGSLLDGWVMAMATFRVTTGLTPTVLNHQTSTGFSTPTTPVTITPAFTATQGSMLLIILHVALTSILPTQFVFTDTLGNTYYPIVSETNATAAPSGVYMYAANNIAPGSYQLTFAILDGNDFAGPQTWLDVYEISNVDVSAIPTFRFIENTDLAFAIFGASGTNHNPGAVPDPGSSSGTTRFLNENATWMTAVTSVAHTLTVPSSVFSSSVSGSPITTSGTLADTITLQTQTANFGWFGPTTGAAATPTFRALVNADLPATAVTPGSYTNTNLTVNQQGVITAAANGTPGSGGVNEQTASYTAVAGDDGKDIVFNVGITPLAASFVQLKSGTEIAFTNSGTVTFTSNNTPGNSILVAVKTENAGAPSAVSSMHDSQGNTTYTRVVTAANTTGNGQTEIWRVDNIKTGANTVTVVINNSSDQWSFDIYETSPLGTVDLAKTTTASSGSTTWAIGPYTPGFSNEFILAAFGTQGGRHGGSATTPFTFGSDNSGSTNDVGVSLYLAQSAAAAVTPTTTGWTLGANYAGVLASFKGGAPPAPVLKLPASPPSSTWKIYVQNIGSQSLTVNRNGLTIDGAASNLTVPTNMGLYITTDGTNYFTERGLLPSDVAYLDVTQTWTSAQAFGTITATTFDGLTITNTTGTFTLANGKTLTVDNSLEFAGTDSTKFTFPGASDTVVTLGAVQTLTNKSISTSQVNSGLLALANGGTDANLSGTGGTSQVLHQSSTGAAITVSQLAASDLSNGTTGTGAVVLANAPTLATYTCNGTCTNNGNLLFAAASTIYTTSGDLYIRSAGVTHIGSGGSNETINLDADGGMIIGAPTGGSKGAGTLNVAGAYYANGVAGISAGPYTVITSITVTNGIITALAGH